LPYAVVHFLGARSTGRRLLLAAAGRRHGGLRAVRGCCRRRRPAAGHATGPTDPLTLGGEGPATAICGRRSTETSGSNGIFSEMSDA
jgi:hypothetical protein